MHTVRNLSLKVGSVLFLWLFSVAKVAAASGFGAAIPTIPSTATGTVADAIGKAVTAFSLVLGAVAIAFVVAGGIRILTAGGNEQNVESGKKMITYALVGLAVVFFANVGINFILVNVLN